MIELDLTTSAITQLGGGFITAGQDGQEVQLALSAEWQGLRLSLRFSDGYNTRTVLAQGGAAEIPVDIISTPWRPLALSVVGYDGDGRRVRGPLRCRLGMVIPGTLPTGGGSGADMSNYYTRAQVDARIPDTSDLVFIAEYNVTTAQEIIAFLDAAKEPFAPILVKRGADYYTVTTASKQSANKVFLVTFASLSGNYYTFKYTITDGIWASSSYGFQKILESGTNIKTVGGQSLLGSGDIPIQGGTQVQANWNEADDTSPAYIQNKPTIPDVGGFATQQWVRQTISALDGTNMQF